MPPKRSKATKPKPRVSEEAITAVDVQYNPDILEGMMQDLNMDMESKCQQLQKEIDFMATSIQQAFHLELIKLPTQVKQMSLSKFKQEYGDSLEAVTKGAMSGTKTATVPASAKQSIGHTARATANVPSSAVKSTSNRNNVFETPSNPHKTSSLLRSGTVLRAPKEGEVILSSNGSPLGEFCTAVKAPKNRPGLAPLNFGQEMNSNTLPPPTPGFVALDRGDMVAIEDVAALPAELKDDALAKMEAMMSSMQAMMSKLKSNTATTADINSSGLL